MNGHTWWEWALIGIGAIVLAALLVGCGHHAMPAHTPCAGGVWDQKSQSCVPTHYAVSHLLAQQPVKLYYYALKPQSGKMYYGTVGKDFVFDENGITWMRVSKDGKNVVINCNIDGYGIGDANPYPAIYVKCGDRHITIHPTAWAK
jgi:hypothetical protein